MSDEEKMVVEAAVNFIKSMRSMTFSGESGAALKRAVGRYRAQHLPEDPVLALIEYAGIIGDNGAITDNGLLRSLSSKAYEKYMDDMEDKT
jgi:hypothetical protein